MVSRQFVFEFVNANSTVAFHPHVTIGRAKGISQQTQQAFLRSCAETEFGLFKVVGFELYSSVLAAAGATHRVEMHL